MNWDYTASKSYVDVIPPSPVFTPLPAYERAPYWPSPSADARLKAGIQRQPCSSEQLNVHAQHFGGLVVHGPGSAQVNNILPSQRPPLLRTTSLPPVDPSKQLASTPELRQGVQSPASTQTTPAIPQSAFTPSLPAAAPGQHSVVVPNPSTMADPRRTSESHWHVMGPPETPSRVMQASPHMFASLQFSPDLFSAPSVGQATTPAYPQQRLFWDQSTTQSAVHATEIYHNTSGDSLNTSFHSSSTVVPAYSPVSQDGSFVLPSQQPPAVPFLDMTAFPVPFQTSPRPSAPAIENPTQFLSSPARRFGGSEMPSASSLSRPVREVPAYHHQIEESRREKELERRRTRNAARRADADLIMSSVRRALSPSKNFRPGLNRSQTHSGISPHRQLLRRPSKVSFNDSTSASSIASVESSRNGRASPINLMRQKSSSSLSHVRSSVKARTAMSLAIDENGVAKTVVQQFPNPDDDDDMNIDDESQSVVSSIDEDFDVLHSQTTSFAIDQDDTDMHLPRIAPDTSDRYRGEMRSPNRSGISHDTLGISTISKTRVSQRGTIHEPSKFASTGKGDAQKALLAIIGDRSRSLSTQGGGSSSRQSESSIQFHSSPPIQQNQFGDFNNSPTTVTDPDLATPSTDHESFASLSATRCVCDSLSPDGSAMIQCDACSKWLHVNCVGIDKRRLSDVYVCVYCEQTPVRHQSNRGPARSSTRDGSSNASPLAHKSTRIGRGC